MSNHRLFFCLLSPSLFLKFCSVREMFAGAGAAVSGAWKARCSDSCPRTVSKIRDSHLLPLLRNSTGDSCCRHSPLQSQLCCERPVFVKGRTRVPWMCKHYCLSLVALNVILVWWFLPRVLHSKTFL